jgi:hypothetical protein
MTCVFADSHYFFALVNPRDKRHTGTGVLTDAVGITRDYFMGIDGACRWIGPFGSFVQFFFGEK